MLVWRNAMKNTAEMSPLLILLFVTLLLVSTGVKAELENKIVVGTPSNQTYNSSLPASSILEHNNRLLYGTTIGATLIKTTNNQAKELHKQALILNEKAIDAYRNGKENLAKEYATQSIHIIYNADRQHYNLATNDSSH